MSGDSSSRIPESGTPERSAREIHLATYRYLRWSMMLLPLTLLLTAALTSWLNDLPFQGSLSAYYGQPVRDVFVGVLIATGVCMVVYQGASLVEDYLLNMAGFYAIFVALIPTTLAGILAKAKTAQEREGIIQAIQISIWIAIILGLIITVVELSTPGRLALLKERTSSGAKAVMAITTLLLLGFFALLTFRTWTAEGTSAFSGLGFGPGWMQKFRVHDYAAVLLIANLAVAVFSHAWPSVTGTEGSELTTQNRDWRRRYQLIFLSMPIGLAIGLFGAILKWDHTVIFLEVWEIAAFMVFWFFETLRVRLPRTSHT